MAKQNEGASGAASSEQASPYVTEETTSQNRLGWLKTKKAKITGVAVAGAVALVAAFAGGAVAGQIASHNDGPAIGAPFSQDHKGDFDRDGDHRPPLGGQPQIGDQSGPNDFDHDGPHGQPPLGGSAPVAPNATTQNN